jgi:hypothetical protein
MAISVKVMHRPEPESTSYLRAALSGMALTFKHLVNPVKVTQQYPEEMTELHPRSLRLRPRPPDGAGPRVDAALGSLGSEGRVRRAA